MVSKKTYKSNVYVRLFQRSLFLRTYIMKTFDFTSFVKNKRTIENIFNKCELKFLKQLYYWCYNSKNYGVEKDERVWIYNTLEQWAEQLGVSKSTVQRAIRSLKQSGVINSAHLSRNKRNRTLFYSVNEKALEELLDRKTIRKSDSKFLTTCLNIHKKSSKKDHMSDHMYIKDNNNKFYKSYKSKSFNKNQKGSEILNSSKNSLKPTIVQDMIKILRTELPHVNFNLTKATAKYLVAAFKTKFNSSLEEWKKHLKLLKTSSYLTGEKFKLSIMWIIKFFTIDRLREGDLGVDERKIPVDQDLVMEEALNHIESVNESDICKNARRKIIKIFSPLTYNCWFKKIAFVEIGRSVFMKQMTESKFVKEYITNKFCYELGIGFS